MVEEDVVAYTNPGGCRALLTTSLPHAQNQAEVRETGSGAAAQGNHQGGVVLGLGQT